MMDSSISNNFHHQNNQPSSGLLRFRSAPSTLLANFNDNGVSGNDCGLNFQQFEEKPGGRVRETAVNYPNSGQSYSGLPPHYPRQNSGTSSSAMDSSFGLVGSMPMNHREQVKRLDASLARQSSSPGGLFGNLSIQNGYNGAKLAGTYGGMNGTDREGSPRLNSQLSFPSRGPSSIGMLAQISQVGNESMDTASPVNGKHGNSNGNARFYRSPRYSYASWNDSHFPGNFSIATKRDEDNNTKLFSSPLNGELDSRVHLLSHHLSLPKTSAEMVAMEKFLHFQDSVPCKIRAKRGCATHPRSIAERVRRTRISERMRKLQDLVPNMDKQTNTADMLDLAVDYIKELQRQYKSLSDSRANCRCSSRQKAVQNQMS